MELNNYKSVTPLKKKRRKVTASAAVILCLLSLIVGVLCGKASADKDVQSQVDKKVDTIKINYQATEAALEKKITTYESEINRLKKELAEANITITNNEQTAAQQVENSDVVSAQKDTSKDTKDKDSGGLGRILIIVILIAVIGACGFFIVKIYMKKNNGYDDEDYEDDDEYYDEDYEDYDDDDEYYDEDDEDYDDDDEYYDEDDEYEDDEE